MSNDKKGPDDKGPNNDNNGPKDKDDVIIEAATPNGVFRGSFDKNTKIADVIAAIVKDRKLVDGDAFELFHDGKVLAPVERPLVSFGLKGHVKLTLVATGSGV